MDGIRKGRSGDIKDILILYRTCSNWLTSQGMLHWEGVYSRSVIAENITEKSTYVYVQNNTIVGVINIISTQPWYYTSDETQHWQSPQSKALYIKGLAVDPTHHGSGYGNALLQYAEYSAGKQNISYIRLDCVQNDMPLIAFYKKRNYFIRCSRDTGNPKFYFFEKRLTM